MLAPDRAVQIRPASPHDVQAAGSVVRRTWMSAYGHIFGTHQIEGFFAGKVRCSLAWVEERAAELGSWVASADGEVIASAGLHLRKDGDAELSHLYVLQEYQGAGTGSALLATCCRALREHGCLALKIWVLERTPAVAFYQKHQAVEIGRDVTVVGTQAEPTLCMRIRLWTKRLPTTLRPRADRIER